LVQYLTRLVMKKQIQDIKNLRKWKFSWRLLWENFVFKHDDHFYKMPTFLAKNIMYRENDSYEKLIDAMKVIKIYFWPLTKIPKTELFKEQSWHYIMKQKSIPGEMLSKKNLKNNPKLLSKFKRLVIANELMWVKEWVFLDLLWSDIVSHPQTIHNLFTDWENIYIFDFWLLEKQSKNNFFRYFSRFGTWLQLSFLKIFY
jgi:hypothetical protein